MRAKIIILCGLFVGSMLLADSTAVDTTVADSMTASADTLKPLKTIDKVLQCVIEEGKRLNILKGFLLKRLEAAEAELDTTAIESASAGRLSLGRTDGTRGQNSSQ